MYKHYYYVGKGVVLDYLHNLYTDTFPLLDIRYETYTYALYSYGLLSNPTGIHSTRLVLPLLSHLWRSQLTCTHRKFPKKVT